MTYNIVAVRTGEEDDGTLYPVVGDHQDPIELEPVDGSAQRLVANGLTVLEAIGGGIQTVVRVPDARVDVMITDARVAVICDKFDKGSTWWGFGGGGVAIAAAATAVSRIRAANRRRGKHLVGQIRYPWLRAAGFKNKRGFGSSGAVRLGTVVKHPDGMSRELYLDLGLPNNVDATAVAIEIIRRSARFRLRDSELTADHRKAFVELSKLATLAAPEGKAFRMCSLPDYYAVGRGLANHPAAEVTT